MSSEPERDEMGPGPNCAAAPPPSQPECSLYVSLLYEVLTKFYVVRAVHFGIKLYNDQRNAQVFNFLSVYFYLICFGLSFTTSAWLKSPGPGADTIPKGLEPRRNYTPASEDGLKESPKHVTQKSID
jgi:hypothetical protein